MGTRSHGLSTLDRQTHSFVRASLTPETETIWDVLVDGRGNVWVGTLDAGLFRIDAVTGATVNYRFILDEPTSLGSNTVWTVFEDRQGTIWAGTKGGGLNRFDPGVGRFSRFYGTGDFPRDLAGQTITAIAEDRAGILWLGTSADGLRMWDRTTNEYVPYKHDPQDPESLAQGRGTGTLSLLPRESGAAPATIRLSQGRPVGARWGHREGAEAVYQLFERAFAGTYAFDVTHPTVAGPFPELTALIREGVRRARELQRSSAVVPEDLPLEATGAAPGTVVDEPAYDLVVALWEKACARVPVRQIESELAVDAFPVHRPLAQWLEEGALRFEAPPAEALAPESATAPDPGT